MWLICSLHWTWLSSKSSPQTSPFWPPPNITELGKMRLIVATAGLLLPFAFSPPGMFFSETTKAVTDSLSNQKWRIINMVISANGSILGALAASPCGPGSAPKTELAGPSQSGAGLDTGGGRGGILGDVPSAPMGNEPRKKNGASKKSTHPFGSSLCAYGERCSFMHSAPCGSCCQEKLHPKKSQMGFGHVFAGNASPLGQTERHKSFDPGPYSSPWNDLCPL